MFFGNILNKFNLSPEFLLTDLTFLVSVLSVYMLIHCGLLLAHIITLFTFKIFSGGILCWKFNVAQLNFFNLMFFGTLNLIQFCLIHLYRLFIDNLRTLNFFLVLLNFMFFYAFYVLMEEFFNKKEPGSPHGSTFLMSRTFPSRKRTVADFCHG